MIDIAMPRHAREPSSSMNGRLAQASRFDDALLILEQKRKQPTPLHHQSRCRVREWPNGRSRTTPTVQVSAEPRAMRGVPSRGLWWTDQDDWTDKLHMWILGSCGVAIAGIGAPPTCAALPLTGDLTDAAFVNCAGLTKCFLLLSARIEFDRPAG